MLQCLLASAASTPADVTNGGVSGAATMRSPADVPRFIEQAGAAGLEHVYDGPWEYFVGGGVASFDCDQDRLPDLFIAGGANEAALFVNRSAIAGPLHLRADRLRQPPT